MSKRKCLNNDGVVNGFISKSFTLVVIACIISGWRSHLKKAPPVNILLTAPAKQSKAKQRMREIFELLSYKVNIAHGHLMCTHHEQAKCIKHQ